MKHLPWIVCAALACGALAYAESDAEPDGRVNPFADALAEAKDADGAANKEVVSVTLAPVYALTIGDQRLQLAEGKPATVKLDGKAYKLELQKAKTRRVALSGLAFDVPGHFSAIKKTRTTSLNIQLNQYSFNGGPVTVRAIGVPVDKLPKGNHDFGFDYKKILAKMAKRFSLKQIKEEPIKLQADSGITLTGKLVVWEGIQFGKKSQMKLRRYEVKSGGDLVIVLLFYSGVKDGNLKEVEGKAEAFEKMLKQSLDFAE